MTPKQPWPQEYEVGDLVVVRGNLVYSFQHGVIGCRTQNSVCLILEEIDFRHSGCLKVWNLTQGEYHIISDADILKHYGS